MSSIGTDPDITVVIPVRNGASTIGAQLDALAAQRTTCTWELVVADNGSTDGTRSAVTAHRIATMVPTRIVDASRAVGANTARNLGVGASCSPIIVMSDCDDVVQAGWLEAFWLALRNRPPTVAAGPISVTLVNSSRTAEWGQPLESPTWMSATCPLGWGTNMGFHRAVWDRVGGFDETYTYGFEDVDFFARALEADTPFVWVDDASVAYRLPANPWKLLTRVFLQGRASITFRERHQQLDLGEVRLGSTALAAVTSTLRLPLKALRGRSAVKQSLRTVIYQTGEITALLARRIRTSSRR